MSTEHDAIHVIVDKSPEELTSLAVEFGGCATFSAPQVGTAQPVQILQRRPTRSKAIIRIDALSGGATAVVLAHRQDYLANAGNPQGFQVVAVPFIIQWENQQPCYAACIAGGPVNVSVIDQAQAAAQAVAEEALEMDSYPAEHDMQEGAMYGGQRDANQY